MSALDLKVRLGRLELQNPILLASGTCGYGADIAGLVDLGAIGGLVTKTVTPQPRTGNPPPRIAEVTGGMLNSIGLENVGVDAFLRDKAPSFVDLGTQIIVSVGGHTAGDYRDVVGALEDADAVAGYELNLSCPNVSGGLDFSTDPSACGRLVGAVRRQTERSLWVKLTPNVGAMAPIAQAAADAGADAVALVNTYLGMAIDVERRRAQLATVVGGLSGPAIRPLALARVFEVSRAVGVPVVGIGGIASAQHVAEFLLAGATAVQVGTHNFVDPQAPGRWAQELAAYLNVQGLARAADLRHAFQGCPAREEAGHA